MHSPTIAHRVDACNPVGDQANSIARATNGVVHQIAGKYRNSDHRLDLKAESVSEQGVHHTAKTDAWLRSGRDHIL